MAFPLPRGTPTHGNVAADAGSTTITLPTGIVVGDRVQVWLAVDGVGTGTWPAGWTQVFSAPNGNAVAHQSYYRQWTGTETLAQGSGGSIIVTHASNQSAWVAAIVCQVGTYDPATPPEAVSVTAASAIPNPPPLNPGSWAIEDTAWYASCGWDNGQAALVSNPASYTAVDTDRSNTTQGVGVAVARRDNAVASEDPGSFTLSQSRPWSATITGHRPGGAVTSFSINAETGVYGVTGAPASLTKAKRITADAGAYGLTGSPATFIHVAAPRDPGALTDRMPTALAEGLYGDFTRLPSAASLDAQPGLYTITGQPAALTVGRRLDAQPGTYSITGQPAALTVGRRLDLVPGLYLLTGQPVEMARHRTLALDQGLYALTGQPATFPGLTRYLEAVPGLYALTGTDTNLIHGTPTDKTLSADFGVYALTGLAMTPVATRRLLLDIGHYDLAGQPATLTLGGTLNAEPGLYSLTGLELAPGGHGRLLPADTGHYLLTGSAAAFLVAPGIVAEAGLYTLTGYPAALVYIPLGTEAVSLAAHGAEPRWQLVGQLGSRWSVATMAGTRWDLQHLLGPFDQGLVIRPPRVRLDTETPGQYAITGYPALLARGFTLLSVPGFYALSGRDATPRTGRVLEAQPGAYALTGQAQTGAVTRHLDLAPGLYLLGGRDAGIFRGGGFQAEAGLYTLVGAPAVLRKQHAVWVAETGAYLVSGLAATPMASQRLDLTPGVYAVAGQPAGFLRAVRIQANAGLYGVAGSPATGLRGLRLPADPGTYAVTGSAQTGRFTRYLPLTTGVYTLAGRDAGLFQDSGFQAEKGTHTIAGSPALFVRTLRFLADTGHYTLTGQRTMPALALTEGHYGLSGRAADLVWSGPVIGRPAMTGFIAKNNDSTPDSMLDMTADWVTMTTPTGQLAVVHVAGAPMANNLFAIGVNGRDLAPPLPADVWVHFYWIYNPTTLFMGTLCSQAPPSIGPTLPPGFTHTCYAATVLRISNALRAVRIVGSEVFYALHNDDLRVLDGGQVLGPAFGTIALWPVPPVSRRVLLYTSMSPILATGAPQYMTLRLRATGDTHGGQAAGAVYVPANGVGAHDSMVATWTCSASQSMDYTITYSAALTFTAGGGFIDVYGYTVPNGSE